MKTYTATAGVVDGIGDEMIEIHSHGEHHDQPDFQPVLATHSNANDEWYEKMKKDMKHRTHLN